MVATLSRKLWTVDEYERMVEVYSEPTGGKYGAITLAGPGETVALSGGLAETIAVDDVVAQ